MSNTPASLVRLFPFCLLMAYGPCVPGSSKPDPTADPSDPVDTGDTPSDGDCDTAAGDSLSTWYADPDGDGYGNAWDSVEACAAPEGYIADNTDCAGGNADRHPGAVETCNELDDDCDGLTDEDVIGGGTTWYDDDDRDGYGNPDDTAVACTVPDGYVADGTDCDDTESGIYPGATEDTGDDVDNDCDGAVDESGSGSSETIRAYFALGFMYEEEAEEHGHYNWLAVTYYTVEGEWMDAEDLCDACDYGLTFTATHAPGLAEDNGWYEPRPTSMETWPYGFDEFSLSLAFVHPDGWSDGHGMMGMLNDDGTWSYGRSAHEVIGGPWSTSYETWTDEPYAAIMPWLAYSDGPYDVGVLYVALPE